MIPFAGLAAAAGAKIAEEGIVGAVESNANTIAGIGYHFTDGRFTAWGASSKVLVPQAPEQLKVQLVG